MPCITISIVNHNSVDPLQECLRSVFQNVTNLSYEIFVVDNLCEEQARPILEKCFTQVQIITNTELLGFSANHNQVLRIAAGDYCLVLNPDVILEADVLDGMVAFMEKHPEVASCSPSIVYGNGCEKLPPKHVGETIRDAALFSSYMSFSDPSSISNLQDIVHRFEGWAHDLKASGLIRKKRSDDRSPGLSSIHNQPAPSEEWHAVPAVWGTCVLFRKTALDQVGLLDEGYFMYYEDIDWCLRARKAGWAVAHLPTLRVSHEGAYSTRQDALKYIGKSILSGLRFHNKHSSPIRSLFLRTMISAIAVINIIRWSVTSTISVRRRQVLNSWIALNEYIFRGVWNSENYRN